MATTIINPPSTESPVLTSSLYSVKARTDKIMVPVEIVRDPDGDSDTFFSTTLYALNGIVELSDVGTLIEECFRAKNKVWNMVEIRFDGVTAEFTALYCEYDLPEEFDCTRCFLTSAGESVVHRNSAISLTHWSNGSNAYHVKIVGLDSDGNTAAIEHTLTKIRYLDSVSFTVNDILKMALAPTGNDAAPVLSSVSYFAISYGTMQKIFYLVDHPFFLTFGFRNMFNAYEYLDVVGIVSSETKVDRDIAVCSGVARQYNQTVERTYEVQTGPLTDSQVRELEQLIASRETHIYSSGREYRVIITDHSAKSDNDDESLTSIKFSFRFADRRPVALESDLGALMPSDSQIFSSEFTPEFA